MKVLLRMVAFVCLTIVVAPLQLIFLFVFPFGARWLPVYYFRTLLWLFGVRVVLQGDHPTDQTLIVCNHISWLDILVLGAQRPVHFVAKAEISSWPLFGQMAKLHRTIFIDRTRRHQARAQNTSIVSRLEKGDCLVLFPEGTSSDGLRVLPFKSALFAAVMPDKGQMQYPVQPVSMVYTRKSGLAMGRRQRSAYGWYGDTELAPHLLYVLASPSIQIDLYYHTVPSQDVAAHRKELALYCESLVRDGMEQIVRQGLAPTPENG
jgi:lyso-ornithine lipid O-acyltransferase